jgi:hypothetical protein
MTVEIPSELQELVRERAAARQIDVTELVREALASYFRAEEQLREEFADWDAVSDEALDLVDGDPAP